MIVNQHNWLSHLRFEGSVALSRRQSPADVGTVLFFELRVFEITALKRRREKCLETLHVRSIGFFFVTDRRLNLLQ